MVSKHNHLSSNIGKQIGAMKSRFPNFLYVRHGNNIVFSGSLQVKPELPIYDIEVTYRGNARPLVYVKSPALVNLAPHTYKDQSLCLYHPDNFHWSADRLIAKEIMHWAIAWIYFYEYWKDSGEWVGPEAPHTGVKLDNDDNKNK